MPATAPVGDLSNPIPGLDDASQGDPGARPRVRRGGADAARGGGRGARRPAARGDDRAGQGARRSRPAWPAACTPPRRGGQGWTRTEWVLVEEQYGRSTNAINWHVPNAYNVWAHASDEQIDRYLRPALRGEAKDAYAVTERGRRLGPLADRGRPPSGRDGGFVINGEKWFVTSGDVATVLVVMANLVDGADRLPTLFVVDSDRAGRRDRRRPATSRTAIRTATRRSASRTSRSGPRTVIGEIGGGDDLQRSWFSEERLGIAARGVGAMWRLLDETVDWATAREQGGERIYDYQGVSFPLADSAADAAAGRLLALQVARDGRRGRRPEARPPQGLDGEAVRQRGRLALRRPLRPGVRRPRLPALQRRRALPARAARRPDLGGDQRDPAADHRQGPRAPRRRSASSTECPSGAPHRPDPAPLLEPRSVAVVGANDRPGSYGDMVLRNLERGRVRRAGLGRQPDAATRCTAGTACRRRRSCRSRWTRSSSRFPAAKVPASLAEAAERGCGGAIVFSAGFGEAPGGAVAGSASCARSPGGPGSRSAGRTATGSISVAARAPLWGDSVPELRPGPVAMITQSGNLGGQRARLAPRHRLPHASSRPATRRCSTPSDWLAAVAARDGVRSIALFLEEDGDGARLAEALALCAERGVGVAVLKVGESRAGAAAAAAHTGARRRRPAGLPRAGGGGGRGLGPRPARAAGAGASAGRAARAARRGAGGPRGPHLLGRGLGDRRRPGASRREWSCPPLADETERKLAEVLPDAATPGNPLDYTSMIWGDSELLASIVEAVGADPGDRPAAAALRPPRRPAPRARGAVARGQDRARRRRRALRRGGADRLDPPRPARRCRRARARRARDPGGRRPRHRAGLRPGAPARAGRPGPAPGDRRRGHPGRAPAPNGAAGEWLGEAAAKRLLRDGGLPVPEGVELERRRRGRLRRRCERAGLAGGPEALRAGSAAQERHGRARARHRRPRKTCDEPASACSPSRRRTARACWSSGWRSRASSCCLGAGRRGRAGGHRRARRDLDRGPRRRGGHPPARRTPGGSRTGSARCGARICSAAARGGEAFDVDAAAELAARLGDLLLERGLDLIELNPVVVHRRGCVAVDALAR